ncbi:MBL fold metallo-hydrolase [Acuticoccus sp. I52.16.1]|uniref:MBL fold metallo-hydrolase n=1 Tax=Acuticoccus sp. I52.16.1 TaxID=2928472 RepID=UPI001FD2FECD|nr:MBL fold metallo-hydrolase [Acuticoccus sp. I52.16.1]UOM32569.1 MBL fold metallo-hydrolase [Acuticoccus sp. I52.16.1]
MTVSYEILLEGSAAALDIGYIGLTNITLVHTDTGPILVDVGHMVNRQGLERALAERGMRPADVGRIFLSHLHGDHVLNLHMFPTSTEVFVSRTEYEYAANPHPKDPFVPFMVREQVARYRTRFLEGAGELAPGVRYLPAPGHTPGCTALVLDTAGGRTVVAQDAIKFPKEVFTQRVNDAFDTPERATETIRHLLTLGDRLIPGHFVEMYREGDTWTWDKAAEVNLRLR